MTRSAFSNVSPCTATEVFSSKSITYRGVYMVSVPEAKTAAPAHHVVAVVLQVRHGVLQALLWKRALEPFAGTWALPGGDLEARETLDGSIRRHLAAKVDVQELTHVEQLETRSDPDR